MHLMEQKLTEEMTANSASVDSTLHRVTRRIEEVETQVKMNGESTSVLDEKLNTLHIEIIQMKSLLFEINKTMQLQQQQLNQHHNNNANASNASTTAAATSTASPMRTPSH